MKSFYEMIQILNESNGRGWGAMEAVIKKFGGQFQYGSKPEDLDRLIIKEPQVKESLKIGFGGIFRLPKNRYGSESYVVLYKHGPEKGKSAWNLDEPWVAYVRHMQGDQSDAMHREGMNASELEEHLSRHMGSSSPGDPLGGGGNQGGNKPLLLRLFYKEGQGFTGADANVRQAYVCRSHFLNGDGGDNWISNFVAFNGPGICPSCGGALESVTLSELEDMYRQVQLNRNRSGRREEPKLRMRGVSGS